MTYTEQLNPVESPIAEFRQTSKRFDSIVAADCLNLQIRKGEFLSFLGPSGCGKTTALRMLAGFEMPSEGEVMLDGVDVSNLPAYRRPVNMVFQHYALFPHMTVADNIAYGLRQQKPRPNKETINAKVQDALDKVRLGDFGDRRIWEMSGGQQQRVALARALVNEPKILLLDEPMAALDAKLRSEMQFELQKLQRELGITFILVTHDQEEALSMSDRICVMGGGKIQQIGTPQELYDRPVNRYVADFVGKSDLFEGRVIDTRGDLAKVELHGAYAYCSFTQPPENGSEVMISVRPESVSIHKHPPQDLAADSTLFQGVVLNRSFLGEHTEYVIRHDSLGEFLVLASRQVEMSLGQFAAGETAYVVWRAGAALIVEQK
ncbi:ABC transporter ATP-binding protein [Neptuniibacter halophilus]|uniref:ABC transporter ATP-binding protein n=1 Tax=Neptuniibacter halophilus TaxID=651666 RepID=UPI0025737BB6|nr:ABC transporter ATP-binding protein [Neptuniibacter halophilus]